MKFSSAFFSDTFIPTAEFDSHPRDIVCRFLAIKTDGYDAALTDWSICDGDMSDILATDAVESRTQMDSTVLLVHER